MQKTITLSMCSLLLISQGHAAADFIASNGPINGTKNAIGIDVGSAIVSNSFTLKSASNVTGVEVVLWALFGSTPSTFEWSLGTSPFDSDIGSGTAHPTNTLHNFAQLSSKYSVFISAFPVSANLNPGVYWLTLKNGRPSDGQGLSWDMNFGPSSAMLTYPTEGDGPYALEVSHSFFIIGKASGGEAIPSPEPQSLILSAIGALILIGLYCRGRLANLSLAQ